MDLLRKQDLAQLQQVVHQLKGAGGGYGFADITIRAGEVEKLLKSDAAVEKIAAEVESLVRFVQRIDGYAHETAWPGRLVASDDLQDQPSTTSASISIFAGPSINRATSTIVVAGRISSRKLRHVRARLAPTG